MFFPFFLLLVWNTLKMTFAEFQTKLVYWKYFSPACNMNSESSINSLSNSITQLTGDSMPITSWELRRRSAFWADLACDGIEAQEIVNQVKHMYSKAANHWKITTGFETFNIIKHYTLNLSYLLWLIQMNPVVPGRLSSLTGLCHVRRNTCGWWMCHVCHSSLTISFCLPLHPVC